MANFKQYKIKKLAGITDLSNVHPGLAAEWWTPEQWAEWNLKADEREAADKAYINELKEKGEYGKEYYLEMSVIDNPIYDNNDYGSTLESASFDILDLSQ